MKKNKNIFFAAWCCLIFVSCFFAFNVKNSKAADLYLSPSKGAYSPESVFLVGVYVSSADQSANAVSGIVSFTGDKLEVVSIDKNGSIFNLWIQEPSFSNSAGTVKFEGIILNPGFSGSAGKIITIKFQAKSIGNSNIKLSSGSILANDGKGTNILTSLGSASFDIQQPKPKEEPAKKTVSDKKKEITQEVKAQTLFIPEIYSPTHPDQNQWYNSNDVNISWHLPSGVNGIRFSIDDNSQTIPKEEYSLNDSKEIRGLADGIWHAHVRFKTDSGWGETSHFKMQIDTIPPKLFKIELVDSLITDNPRPTVLFNTDDELSGIYHYKVKFGESEFIDVNIKEVESNPYTLPLQKYGKRMLLVQAFDKAGNYTTQVEEFIIEPLDEPILNEYPKKIESGGILVIRGSTYGDSQVVVWLQREGENPKTQIVGSDKSGNFTYASNKRLEEGIYKVWTEVIDQRGARSQTTHPMYVVVEKSKFSKYTAIIINILVIGVSILSLAFFLVTIFWHGWRKCKTTFKKTEDEFSETRENLNQCYQLMISDITKYLEMIKKAKKTRKLTKEEVKILRHFLKSKETINTIMADKLKKEDK